MSTIQRVLLLVLALAEAAWSIRMLMLSRVSARTGQPFRDLPGAVPTVLVGVLLAVGLVLVASTS